MRGWREYVMILVNTYNEVSLVNPALYTLYGAFGKMPERSIRIRKDMVVLRTPIVNADAQLPSSNSIIITSLLLPTRPAPAPQLQPDPQHHESDPGDHRPDHQQDNPSPAYDPPSSQAESLYAAAHKCSVSELVA
jgi:hypothetical protein